MSKIPKDLKDFFKNIDNKLNNFNTEYNKNHKFFTIDRTMSSLLIIMNILNYCKKK